MVNSLKHIDSNNFCDADYRNSVSDLWRFKRRSMEQAGDLTRLSCLLLPKSRRVSALPVSAENAVDSGGCRREKVLITSD
ncbi:hypothetical protein Golomagni_03425 [Golovinomyces magnicellulatus]|nr:hypothetical protein Golomagni_03425 [Golovinomyces magnicellulatus]